MKNVKNKEGTLPIQLLFGASALPPGQTSLAAFGARAIFQGRSVDIPPNRTDFFGGRWSKQGLRKLLKANHSRMLEAIENTYRVRLDDERVCLIDDGGLQIWSRQSGEYLHLAAFLT
jgi:hypothetical protein